MLRNLTRAYQEGVQIEERRHHAQVIADRAHTRHEIETRDAINVDLSNQVERLEDQLSDEKRANFNLECGYKKCLKDLRDLNDRLDKTSTDFVVRIAPRVPPL